MQRVSNSPSSVPDSNHPLNPFKTPLEAELAENNAFRAGVMYLIVTAAAFLGEIFLAFDSGAWQPFAIAGIGALLTGVAVAGLHLIRHSRPNVGVRLLIAASLVSALVTPLLVAGFGLILGLGTILVVLTMALQTLPQREANRILLISIGVAAAAGALDIAGGLNILLPNSQLTLPKFQQLISALGGVIIVAYFLLTIRRFSAYPLSTKLILAFLAVSLIPLGLLASLNYRHTRLALIEDARQSLFSAVTKTAADIDAFVNNNLDAVATESQLPAPVAYLSLPPQQRLGSKEEEAAIATLRQLSRKDKVFITSYALLDERGQNILDTEPAKVGQDEADRTYFQKPLETGLPYVSPVEFISGSDEATLAEAASLSLEKAILTFSHPVHDRETGAVSGVLRVHYKLNILQQLIVQNNHLSGEESFPILFDENYIRLAHGISPDLIFKAAVPLSPDRVAALQAANRLPQTITDVPATNLPDLMVGLDNAIFEPYFDTRLIATGNRMNLTAVKELDTLPWLVVFAQPRDSFLAPIQTQTRTTLFLAIAIAGAVAAAAYAMGQFLANPLTNLTKTVTRFTAGNLEARAHIESRDESGLLAASFNTMAEQVGKLLKNLADQTYELEAEISERKRAETELQASEKKYRTLFEDSKDMIFITTARGQITDINPAGVKLSGYTKAELLETDLQDLYVNSEDRYRFLQEISQRGSVSDFRVKFRQKNGSEIDCLMTAMVRRAEDGTILGYEGILRDITEQKRVEQERMRLMAIERELAIAHEIQASLLPPITPNWPQLDVLCYSTPAREVGGDFYAYHTFDNNSFAIAVGDVTGKGTSAALLMSVSLASFQSTVRQSLSPDKLLASLDEAIASYTRNTNQNCALVYLELAPFDAASTAGGGGPWLLQAVNAGCVAPLVRRQNGTVDWVDAYGVPLGTELGAYFRYRATETTLSSGDIVVLTSDGVVEATNGKGELFGFERLEAAIASGPQTSAEAMSAHLQAAVKDFVGSIEPHDDLTVVVVQA